MATKEAKPPTAATIVRNLLEEEIEKVNSDMEALMIETVDWSADALQKGRIPKEVEAYAKHAASLLLIVDKVNEIEGKPKREMWN